MSKNFNSIKYVKTMDDSVISKTKQSDIMTPSTAIIHGITEITMTDTLSDLNKNILEYIETESDYDILTNSNYNFNRLNLNSIKKNTYETKYAHSYKVNNKILTITVQTRIYNFNNIQTTVRDTPYMQITITNSYDGTTKQKTINKILSPNFTQSNSYNFEDVSILFLDSFSHVKTDLTLHYNAPSRINGTYYEVNAIPNLNNGNLKITPRITNTENNMGTWFNINSFNINYQQSSSAGNIYYYTPTVSKWYSPFYYSPKEKNAYILMTGDATTYSIIAYSYQLIEKCTLYAITTTSDLNLRVNYFKKQINGYTLEQCFFDDTVITSIMSETGLEFEVLTPLSLGTGALYTPSDCLKKLLTFNLSSTNSLSLSAIPSSQTITSNFTLYNTTYALCGIGTIILNGKKLQFDTTADGQVIANALITTTLNIGYTSFLVLPEATPDKMNIDCHLSSLLVAGSLESLLYKKIGLKYVKLTNFDEFLTLSALYE